MSVFVAIVLVEPQTVEGRQPVLEEAADVTRAT
jgi:hypothetical protein